MHVCAQDLCITEASNHSNTLLPKVRRLNLIFVPALDSTAAALYTIYADYGDIHPCFSNICKHDKNQIKTPTDGFYNLPMAVY